MAASRMGSFLFPKQPLLNRDRSRSSGRNRLTADAQHGDFALVVTPDLRYPEVCLNISESITFTLAPGRLGRTRSSASKARVMSATSPANSDDVFRTVREATSWRFSEPARVRRVQSCALQSAASKNKTGRSTISVYPEPEVAKLNSMLFL